MDKKFVHSVVEYITTQYPEHVAIKERDRSVTYCELQQGSEEIQAALMSSGISKGDIVAVKLPSGIDLVASILAIFRAGAVYLPVSLEATPSRLEYILRQTSPVVIIKRSVDENAQVPEVSGISDQVTLENGLQVLTLKASGENKNGAPGVSQVSDPALLPEDTNYIFYTSGSTGEPKAIAGQHKSLGHFINWEINEFGLNADVKVSQLAPVPFDASLRDIFVPLCTGGTLVIPSAEERSNMLSLAKWVNENNISLLHTVPSVLRALVKELQGTDDTARLFSRLQYLMLSGEPLFAGDVSKWLNVGNPDTQVVNLYGATETTLIKTFHRVQKENLSDPSRRIPVGKPMANTLVAIINDGILCKEGEIGEVYIKSPFVSKGYLYDDELQAKKFVQNPLSADPGDVVFKTGDLGRYLPDETIELLGRTDGQVKVNGVRIEINEVELAFRKLETVEEAVVLVHTNEDLSNQLVAYYTGDNVGDILIRDHLGEYLDASSVPSYIIHLDEMPLNINGKIDRKALSRKEIIIEDEKPKEPESETEIKLANIWKQVLNLPQVSAGRSFFTIGGTSLKAIQVISRIYKEFGVLLKVGDMFDHATITDMAGLIERTAGQTLQDITPVQKAAHYPATYGQKRLWIVNQLEEDQVSYNMPSAYHFSGKLDVRAFQEALHKVIQRHEILRTTFLNHEGTPRQVVHQQVGLD
ncbi:MAG: amino acid adenylation domain-containing protein, partial [Cyclobacteriaceae bacterium]